MKVHNVKISKSGLSTYGTKIFIDDKEINGVTDICFKHSVDELPTLKLSAFTGCDVDVDGCKIEVDENTIYSAIVILKIVLNNDRQRYCELVSKIQSVLFERKEANMLLPFETEYDLAILIANELLKQ